MDKHDEERADFKYTPVDRTELQQPAAVVADAPPVVPPVKTDEPLFNWSAPDSFSDKKSPLWYLSLAVITAVLAGGIYLLTHDKITTAVIVVSGLLIGIYGGKKPRLVKYQLTRQGFTINGRYHEFGNYRSFTIVHHGKGMSAVLTPLKRFMPYMYIYFGRDEEAQITTALTDVLPKETAHSDNIDRVLRKIGF